MTRPNPRLASYQAARPVDEIDVTAHAPLVKRLASMLIARLPASVDLNDLVQVGIIGLIEAARQYDPGQGVQFETFASQRIRGAMLDELRREDWLPRQVRRDAKQIEQTIARLEQSLGRAPAESEIAEALGLALEDYQARLSECKGLTLVHFNDFSDDEGESLSDALANVIDENAVDPLGTLSDSGFRSALVEAIGDLPERDKLVMALYYEQELNLKEIGAVLGVSESRVSQLHSQAVSRLRARLRDWL
ncbi:RNA polymerase, sigma 28 subunit, SigD/FliA/WhiG [Gulbenkiania indica]|uniref:RNA polymerase sigma factor FliA n=2 Tax=Gulbenkiania TaxID=397456 RepID=A0A0K6H6G1_9NEIS|nr:RNA polymerase sigma factor FliA [Gulbenkiania indica]TCW33667.1 RNA polymerase sigma factor for flagellar operon FliA [Gulbenkiania mobilis]CUA86429.1 RNA polymerase, sigma 28 subunit, SigD/FliA/WhiG [Gulbenkiania indica]